MPSFDYEGAFGYHIIVVTARRARVLVGALARDVILALEEAAAKNSFELLAFVVMPDHLHVLVAGVDAKADLIRFAQRFKQRTVYDYKRAHGVELWQRSYFDHVVRSEERLPDIAEYIVANPVRANLAAAVADWPFVGGRHLDGVAVRDAGALSGAKAPPLRLTGDAGLVPARSPRREGAT